jgi:hypothetical protein
VQRIVTDDGTWVHHCESTSKHHNMEQNHMPLSRSKTLQSVPSASKLLTLFWGINGLSSGSWMVTFGTVLFSKMS